MNIENAKLVSGVTLWTAIGYGTAMVLNPSATLIYAATYGGLELTQRIALKFFPDQKHVINRLSFEYHFSSKAFVMSTFSSIMILKIFHQTLNPMGSFLVIGFVVNAIISKIWQRILYKYDNDIKSPFPAYDTLKKNRDSTLKKLDVCTNFTVSHTVTIIRFGFARLGCVDMINYFKQKFCLERPIE